jgi:hypothetical protein
LAFDACGRLGAEHSDLKRKGLSARFLWQVIRFPGNGLYIRLLVRMDRFCLPIISASILLLVTAFALGTPGLKSEGPPEKTVLLRGPARLSSTLGSDAAVFLRTRRSWELTPSAGAAWNGASEPTTGASSHQLRGAAPFTWNDAAFGLRPVAMMQFPRLYIQQVDGVVADLQQCSAVMVG